MRRPLRRIFPWLVLLVALAGGAVLVRAWLAERPARAPQPGEGPRERRVTAAWFGMAGREPTSGTSEVVVRVAPSDGAGCHVGFVETDAQGTGDTWRASGWMAAVVASLTAGVDLSRYAPTFEVEGRIDGPSAGALLTVAILAALHDRELAPNATLTGTIGPDGSIGPVAGVVHKVEAAVRAGKKLILIPQGQAHSVSAYTQADVDVVAYGKALNADVREVGDIFEAYESLTGHRLPAARPTNREPSLPEDTRRMLTAAGEAWLAQANEVMEEARRLAARRGAPVPVTDGLAATRSTAYLARGEAAAGYDQAITACLQAGVTREVYRALDAIAVGGLDAVAERLKSSVARETEIAALLDEIGGLNAGSPDAAIAVADAYGIVAQTMGLQAAADRVAGERQTPVSEGAPYDSIYRAAAILSLAEYMPEVARERLQLVPADQSGAPVIDRGLSAWSETLRRAAEANLAYFEAICLDEAAREQGLHPDVMRETMCSRDLTYVLARASIEALPTLQEDLGGGAAADTAVLGTAIGAYTTASALIAKFYSLRVRTDEHGDIAGVEDEAGLERMLALATRQARANLAAARDRGMSAPLATLYYLVGRSYAQGDAEEKLEALQCLWQASLSAQIAVLLAEG